jgi:hypothetical protein
MEKHTNKHLAAWRLTGVAVALMAACGEPGDDLITPNGFLVTSPDYVVSTPDASVSRADASTPAQPKADGSVGDASSLGTVPDSGSTVVGGADASVVTGPCVNVTQLLAAAQPALQYCVTCHTQYGQANKSKFVLDFNDSSKNEARIRDAYAKVGRQLATMPLEAKLHQGGVVLDRSSTIYANWDALITAIGDPARNCK